MLTLTVSLAFTLTLTLTLALALATLTDQPNVVGHRPTGRTSKKLPGCGRRSRI